ncbi:MAG: hypothetical protein QOI55_1681 [Actinomycetota bacterium]|nr:hypothetical protein [Actinomycetota bacterium]
MRPTRIVALTTAVLVGLGGLALGIITLFVDRQGGRPWFYWIAPLLAFGFAGMMIQLCIGYWVKIGRLEVKGRPKE